MVNAYGKRILKEFRLPFTIPLFAFRVSVYPKKAVDSS